MYHRLFVLFHVSDLSAQSALCVCARMLIIKFLVPCLFFFLTPAHIFTKSSLCAHEMIGCMPVQCESNKKRFFTTSLKIKQTAELPMSLSDFLFNLITMHGACLLL